MKGMKFHGFCGLLEEERKVGQKIEVDVEMKLDLKDAGICDELSKTVNYEEAFSLIEKICKENKFKLLEALAERIAEALLSKFSVIDVNVVVKKLHPPVKGVMEHVAVSVQRGR